MSHSEYLADDEPFVVYAADGGSADVCINDRDPGLVALHVSNDDGEIELDFLLSPAAAHRLGASLVAHAIDAERPQSPRLHTTSGPCEHDKCARLRFCQGYHDCPLCQPQPVPPPPADAGPTEA